MSESPVPGPLLPWGTVEHYALGPVVAPSMSPVRVSLAGEPWRQGREVTWDGTGWT